MTVKHSGDEAFLFYFLVPTQTRHETKQTGFMVFLQSDTSSCLRQLFVLCPGQTFQISDSPRKGIFFYHSFVGLFLC